MASEKCEPQPGQRSRKGFIERLSDRNRGTCGFLMRQPVWGSSPHPDRASTSRCAGRPVGIAVHFPGSVGCAAPPALIPRCHEQCLLIRFSRAGGLRDWRGSFIRDDLAYAGRATSCPTRCSGDDSARTSIWKVHRRGFEIIYGRPYPPTRRSIKICPAIRAYREVAAVRPHQCHCKGRRGHAAHR